MNLTVRQAEFVLGAVDLVSLPKHNFPEIAFVGRSNVGKSSFVNFLLRRKNLAHSSSTPGKTRELNVYRAELADSKNHSFYLVDLPGFGFAKLSKEQRENLSRLIVDYVLKREELKLVCIVNDCRREPAQDEISIHDLAHNQGCHVMVVLTKLDKLTKREIALRVGAVAQAYGLESSDLYLKDEKQGPEPFWQQVFGILK